MSWKYKAHLVLVKTTFPQHAVVNERPRMSFPPALHVMNNYACVQWPSKQSLSRRRHSRSQIQSSLIADAWKPGKVVKMRRYLLLAHPLFYKFVEFTNKVNKYYNLVLRVLSLKRKSSEVGDPAWLFVGDVTFNQRVNIGGQIFLFLGRPLSKKTFSFFISS